ncbi:MAG TPA: PEGA domain-containing protein, partial [Kofleriaceae bacterium]|nr:PEGA domain-containing protein [Kofleriaceae bacterium]
MIRVLSLAVAVLVAAPAYADKAKAEQYFRVGAQAFKQQHYDAAAESFEMAYKEDPLPEIAFSAAQAYRRQYFIDQKPDHVQRAVELYRAYLDNVKEGGRVGDAADGLAEMKRELDRLNAQGMKFTAVQQTGTRLAVSVTVAGEAHEAMTELSALPASDTTHAKATLDGKPVELFMPVEVAPGEHAIEVTAPGYFPATVKRVAVAGASDVVEVELQPQPGQLAIDAEDGAEVAIDGKPVGTTPLAAQPLVAGKHVVAITRRGREGELHEIQIARAEHKTLDIKLVKTGRRRVVPWMVGGAGAFAVASMVTALVALSADSDLSKLQDQRVKSGITLAQ